MQYYWSYFSFLIRKQNILNLFEPKSPSEAKKQYDIMKEECLLTCCLYVSLYGVVEHSGGLTGGHYTACVKVRPPQPDLSHFFSPSLSRPGETMH